MAGCAARQGDVVAYEDPAHPGSRKLASVVAGPLGDGTYDLTCQRHVQPQSVRVVAAGEAVEYFSASLNRWIPAQVLRKGRAPSTLDLDCKDGVDLSRVRLPDAVGRPSQLPLQAFPATSHTVPQNTVHSAGGLGPLGLQAQEHCYYYSSTHGWIPARVQAFRQDTGLYDLDVKPGVRADTVRCVREGDVVEYFSNSANQWIRARVVRKTATPGHFDLDCKDNVDLGRMRPTADSALGASSASSHSAASPAAPGASPSSNAFSAGSEIGAAREKLQSAVREKNQKAIRDALRGAIRVGLPGEEIEAAERVEESLEALQSKGRAARRQLKEAVDGSDCHALEDALHFAEEAGVPEAELDAARRALKPLAVAEARAELRSAARRQSPRGLREALQLAASAGIPREELEPVQHTLAALEAQASQVRAARTHLQWAVQGRDPQVLQEALQAAASTGLPLQELNEARQYLDDLQAQESARKQLRHALATGGLAELQSALKVGTQARLPREELDAATNRLRTLEAGAQRSRLSEQLQRALETQDASALRQVLEAATASGLSGEEVERAHRTLEAWQRRPAALAELRRRALGNDADALRAALAAATESGVKKSELEHGFRALQALEASSPTSLPAATQPQLGFGVGATPPYGSHPSASSRSPAAPAQPPVQPYGVGVGPGMPTQPQLHHSQHSAGGGFSSAAVGPGAPTQPQLQHHGPGAAGASLPTQPQLSHPGAAASGPAPTQPQLHHQHRGSEVGPSSYGALAPSSGPAPTQPQLHHQHRGGGAPAPTQPQLLRHDVAEVVAGMLPPTRPQAGAALHGDLPPTQPQLGGPSAQVPGTNPKLPMYHQQAPDTDPQLGWAR